MKEFDLSADATIIVGVNGSGKTSLLDAILWSLSGKLIRIGSDEKIVSKYSESGEARVSLQLANGIDEEMKVIRVSDGKSQSLLLSIGGEEYKGTSAEARLVEKLWPEASSASDGQSVLNSAIERSVYLQQDCVRDFLEATNNDERFSIISELVGTGRLTELQMQLDRERTSWTRATNQKTQDTESLAKRVEELEVQYERLKHSSTIEVDDSSSWSEWWSVASSLGLIFSSVPSADSVEASNRINEAIQQLQNIRGQTERRNVAALAIKEILGKEPPQSKVSVENLRRSTEEAERIAAEATSRLDTARKQAAEKRKQQIEAEELKEQKRALAHIALKLLTVVCPVCQQTYDVEQTKKRLGELVAEEGKAEITNIETEESIATLAHAEKKAYAAVMENRKLLAEAEAKEAQYQQWLTQRDRGLSELGIEFEDLRSVPQQLDRIILECEDRIKSLVNHRRAGEQLALNLVRESARARISKVQSDLEAARKELQVQSFSVEYRKQTGIFVNLILDKLREAATQVVIDRLHQIEPLLQRIYSRIDPHPAFRVVKLATSFSYGKGRLNTEVHDRAAGLSSDNPNAVLSSSQLNALAVSIFLALNLGLPRLPIEAALLDDPIQSLDDINLLGLVDLLRRTKDRRQLIVSTHDERFGSLIARKLRPGESSKRTSVIKLHGWTRSGPEINQYDIKPESIPLRLVHTA